ncbi:hypothetical protein LCM20_14020 [Halobacillus litoralis]|uniref:hypothetical protein n=1 Tax=Halobacillus litoralis TaxID=45668 RepID=UPI001CD2A513|nr:hypothetical protein [Halobacillus litoralis]MCA0971719.1 hypothetical protein [Halobacillus litoralis]
MIQGRKWMTVSYQFLSQALLAYFLLYLLADWLSLSFSLIPYLTVIVTALVALLLTSRYEAYRIRVVAVPILIIAVSLLTGIYWLVGLALAGAAVWRYQSLEVDPDFENEHALLLSTSIIAFVGLIFYKDAALLVALLIQFVVLLGGYNLSHYYQVSKADRSKGKGSLSIYAVAVPVTVILVMVLLPGLRSVIGVVWSVISFIFLKGFTGFLDALAFFGIDVSQIRPAEQQLGEEPVEVEENMTPFRPEEGAEYDGTVVNAVGEATQWGVILAVGGAVLIALFVLYRFNKRRTREVEEDAGLTYQSYQWATDGQDGMSSGFKFSRSKADNRIRKQFQKFEQDASRLGMGRSGNESISEWFDRLGLEVQHTSLYQKVRYGSEDLTPEEEKQFFIEMEQLNHELKQAAQKKQYSSEEN